MLQLCQGWVFLSYETVRRNGGPNAGIPERDGVEGGLEDR
jgi:hypothetical protein